MLYFFKIPKKIQHYAASAHLSAVSSGAHVCPQRIGWLFSSALGKKPRFSGSYPDYACRNLSMLAFCSVQQKSGHGFPKNCYLKYILRSKKPTSSILQAAFDSFRHTMLAFQSSVRKKANKQCSGVPNSCPTELRSAWPAAGQPHFCAPSHHHCTPHHAQQPHHTIRSAAVRAAACLSISNKALRTAESLPVVSIPEIPLQLSLRHCRRHGL